MCSYLAQDETIITMTISPFGLWTIFIPTISKLLASQSDYEQIHGGILLIKCPS